MRLAGLAVALAAAAPALAQTAAEPPDWANLAECSAVFGVVVEAGAPPPHDIRADPAPRAARALRDRAVAVAAEAGQADPEGDVASIMDYLVPRWQNRATRLTSVPSNLRWFRFCGTLGRRYGVLPLPD